MHAIVIDLISSYDNPIFQSFSRSRKSCSTQWSHSTSAAVPYVSRSGLAVGPTDQGYPPAVQTALLWGGTRHVSVWRPFDQQVAGGNMCGSIGGFPKMGIPQNHLKLVVSNGKPKGLGYPYFRKPSCGCSPLHSYHTDAISQLPCLLKLATGSVWPFLLHDVLVPYSVPFLFACQSIDLETQCVNIVSIYNNTTLTTYENRTMTMAINQKSR